MFLKKILWKKSLKNIFHLLDQKSRGEDAIKGVLNKLPNQRKL